VALARTMREVLGLLHGRGRERFDPDAEGLFNGG
jgi:hypothetical protein